MFSDACNLNDCVLQSINVKNKLSTYKNQKRGADGCQWKIHLWCVMLLYLRIFEAAAERGRAGERVGGLNWSEKSLPRPDTWMIFYLSRSWKGLALIDGRKHTYSLAHTHTRRLRKWGCNGVTFALFAEVNNSSPRKWEIATNFDGVTELCMALQRQTNSRVTRERNLWTALCCFERWINHFSMSIVYFWNLLSPEFFRSTYNSNG